MKNVYLFSFSLYKNSKICFLFLTAFILLFNNQKVYTQAGWVQQISPISSDVVSVSFINEFTGFACGGTKLIKTTNGGASWYIFDSAFVPETFSRIKFLDQNTGFVGYGQSSTYRTTNGGINWVLVGPDIYSSKIGFVDNTYGWIFDYNRMFLTNNGGLSWVSGDYYPAPHGPASGGYVGSRNFGVAVGNYDDFMHSKMYMYIWKSLDGGSSWVCISGNVYGDPCAYTVIYGFMPPPLFTKTYVVDDYIAFLYGGTMNLRSDNSGSSWSGFNTGSSISGFEFINHNTGYSFGGTGTIEYTTSGGSSWNQQTIPVTSAISGIDMINSLTGWAVGSPGVILKTTTGGLTLPLAPSLISPANNATGIQLTALLDWDDNLLPVNYWVQISSDVNFNTILHDNNTIVASQYNIPAGILTYNTVYYWRVAAKNSVDWGPFSAGRNFRTFFMPGQVTLTSPLNNAIEQPTNITFYWKKPIETLSGQFIRPVLIIDKTSEQSSIINNSGNDAIIKYWFELTTDTVTLAGLITDNNIYDTSKNISGLNRGVSYYWRVKANNDLGWGPFSNWWKFTTIVGPPQPPALISPPNYSFAQYLNLQFTWNKSAEISAKPISKNGPKISEKHYSLNNGDAISAYWFELTEDTVSLTGLVRDSSLTDTSKILNLYVNSRTYYWRVKAKNESGWGVFGNWWKFVTIPAEYGWEVSGIEIGSSLTGINFLNYSIGWVCANQGGNGVVYKTTNGGANWFTAGSNIMMLAKSISFSNESSGVIAAGPYGTTNYPIWNTGDGGTTWNPVAYINYMGSDIHSVANTPNGMWAVGSLTTFGNPPQTYSAIIGIPGEILYHTIPLNRVKSGKNNAWVVGAQGLIYRSSAALNVGDNVNLTGVSFNDDNTGYAAGENKLFKSTNNGGSFFRIYPLSNEALYKDVYFANKDTGWVACSLAGEGVIISTTNGGGSWALQYKGSYSGSEFTFTEKKYGWLLCGNSVLRTTNVAGQQNPPPVLMLPANGATAQSLTPQLDWQDALNSVNYRVQVSADSLLTGLIIDDSTITSSSYDILPGILQNFTQYYWRVASKNSSSWSNFSTRFSFRTFGIPNNVVLSYPPNNASGVGTSLTFNWFTALPTKKTDKQNVSENDKSLRDAAGKLSIGNYWFELTRDTVNLTDLITDTLLIDTSKAVSGLIFSNSYYWRVKAKNEAGWGAFSPWWKFTTTNGAPVLQQPVNNQTEVQVTPLLNWSDVAGALKYRVQVSAFSNFSVLWLDDSSSTASQLQVPNGILAYNSLYYWRVKTRNLTGWGEYQTPIRFFTQIFPPPPVPVLSSPSNGTSGVELTPLLNWNDVSGSTKYRVQVSLSSDFSTTLVDDSSMIASEYIVPNGILNSNTQYFWRAAVKGVSSWSAFSSPWSFNTIGVPQPVTLFNPINNATGQELNINFTWFKATELLSPVFLNRSQENRTSENKKIISEKPSLSGVDAINLYQFEITTDTVTLSGLVVDSTLTDTSKFVSGLIANTSYYWRVKAGNEIGWGPFSTWWKLTTSSGLPPAPPAFIYPLNNAQNISVTPQLDWSDVTGALKYRVQVSAFSNFSVLWIDDSNLTASNYQVYSGVLAYNSVYYWRIKAKNDAGWGTYQATPFRFFTLIFPPPAMPVLLSPANGASGVLLTPLLDWNNVSGSIKYRVQVSAVPDFSSVLIDDSSLVNSEFNIPVGLLNNGSVYYWKASARSTASWGDFSAPWSFTTLGLPLPVVLSNPGNNSIEQPLNITFTWLIAHESLNKLNKKNNTQNNKSSIFGISNKDGSDAINSYWFEMTTDTVSFAGLVRDTALTDTTKIINGLSSLTEYYWRVRAGNEIGWGLFSTWWKFTTSSGLPPAPPNFIYPLNNAQNISVTPQLDWGDVTGALKYRVQVSAFSNFSVLWIDDSNLTASNYQVNSGVLAYNSVYYWRIKAKNDAGWGNYQSSPFRFFTLIIPPPAIPVLVTPFNGSTGISLTPLLDWNDVNGTLKYRLQIAEDTGFTNIITDDSTLVSSQYNVSAGLLANSTVYYWKVAAKNSFYWSAFSGKFNFKTFGSPQIVTLLSPANNSIEQPLNITFTWMKAIESMKKRESEPKLNAAYTGNVLFNEKTGVDAISKYWFEIVTDTVTMTGLISDTTLTDTTKSVSGLTALTNYFWRVKAFNEVGWGPFSMWWKLTTISGLPPAPPAFIYPLNNAQNITVTPQLDWSDVPGALKYRVQVSAFSNFSVLWIDDSNSVASYFQVLNGVLAYNSVYYWRVKAKNDAGWGEYQVSPIRFFTLITPPQAPPVLLSPANGAVNIPLNTLLDWNDISSALKYRVQVSTANTFVANIIDDSSLSASQYNISSGMLGYNTVYYWRVSVKTGSVWSSFSNSWSFTTVTALNSPVLKTPLSKDTGVVVTTLFNWLNVSGATSYRLQVSAFSNFSVLWIDKYVTDTLYQTPNGVLAYNSRYFWKVKALRTGDSSSFSNPNYFFTKIFPYNDNLPEFEESKLLDLSGLMSNDTKTDYSIEISKDTLFDVLSVKLDNLKGEKQELRLDMFDDYSTYYWRVYTSGAKQQYSATNVFVTYITKQHLLMNLRGNSEIPEKYALYQNYPNPFNPVCKIRFDIPKIGNLKMDFVKLVIYDLIGREIAVLVNDNFDPGIYEVTWNAANHSSGIYICQIKTSIFTDTKKMVLLK